MQSNQNQSEKQTVLLVCDSRQDMQQIEKYLESKEFNYESTPDVRKSERLLRSTLPSALLLRFSKIGKTIEYCREFAVSELPTQTIVLCDLTESEQAADLVKQRLINDYFIFKPVYDWNRLQACIENVFARESEVTRLIELRKQLDEYKTYLKELNDMFRELKKETTDTQKKIAPQTADAATKSKKATQPPLILIVDVAYGDTEYISTKIKNKGYAVLHAANVIQAINFLRHTKADLILMSQDLPNVSGLKIAERFKNDSRLASIPIILMADAFSDEMTKRAQRVGLTGLLTKPIDTGKMLEKIEEAFKHR